MLDRYKELVSTIEQDKREIRKQLIRSPYGVVRQISDAIAQSFEILYDILSMFCREAESTKGLARYDEMMKRQIYKTLQDLASHHDQIVSSPHIDSDLYLLQEDIKKDIGIQHPICLKTGTEFVTRYPVDFLPEFDILATLQKEEMDEARRSLSSIGLRVVEIPRSEIANPFAWALLIHEYCHQLRHIEDDLAKMQGVFGEGVPRSKREELLIDLISVNYLGPVYAIMIARLPDKIGKHGDLEHPSPISRIRYLTAVIDWYIDQVEKMSEDPESSTELLSVILDRVKEMLEEAVGEPEEMSADDERLSEHVISNIDDIQKTLLKEVFDRRGIPVWHRETQKVVEKSSLRGISSQELPEKLRELVTKGDVLPTLKPSILLNVALLIGQDEGSPLEMKAAMLFATKKWAVVRSFDPERITD